MQNLPYSKELTLSPTRRKIFKLLQTSVYFPQETVNNTRQMFHSQTLRLFSPSRLLAPF